MSYTDPDHRLTVAVHIQRPGETVFPNEPLGFSVDLGDPQDIRRGVEAWEELAFVIEHVLEEALEVCTRAAIKDTFRGMESQ